MIRAEKKKNGWRAREALPNRDLFFNTCYEEAALEAVRHYQNKAGSLKITAEQTELNCTQ